jgi:2-(3-amino-3-carboxypropyl)histidine synthase
MFDLEKDNVLEFIKNGNYHRVLLQLPEGLKSQGFKLAKEIEDALDVEVVLSANACYGACQLAVEEQTTLRADAIIHYGHSPLVQKSIPNVLYVEARATENVEEAVRKALKILEQEKKIGLATVVQHLDQLEHVSEVVRESGKEPYLGEAGGQVVYDGQVLGCDYSTSLRIAGIVEAYIFIGGGDFHAIGIQLATGRRTIVADPYANQARDMTETVRLLLRKRWAAITKFQDSSRIGVVIGVREGQFDIESALRVKRLLEENGKHCVLLSASECTPESLESFTDLEAFVITACPRIAIDDQERFRRPILNIEEAHIAAGKRRWEDYGKSAPQQETA